MHVCVSCLQVFCLLLKGSLCIITVVNKKLSCRRDSTHRRSLHFISRSFKVTSFGTCHKPMVLLVNTTNLHPVTHRLQVFVDNWLQWIINCCEYYRRRDANVVMNVYIFNMELYLPQLFSYQVLSLLYSMVYLPHLLPPIFSDYFTSSTS